MDLDQAPICVITRGNRRRGFEPTPERPESQLHQLCMEQREAASGRKLARWAEPWQEDHLCGERVDEPLPEV